MTPIFSNVSSASTYRFQFSRQNAYYFNYNEVSLVSCKGILIDRRVYAVFIG